MTLDLASGRRRTFADIGLLLAFVLVLSVLVIPLPAALLDLLLALSIGTSVVMLFVALQTRDPLEFSSFPTVLLLVTLFRLALNVASTRLILGSGHGGAIIQGFGRFLIGGNFAVGVVIFLILVAINFVVITKGAGRIAEVTARFTLDAMPGKQMAIDADLAAGLIDDKEAKRRREEVGRQAGEKSHRHAQAAQRDGGVIDRTATDRFIGSRALCRFSRQKIDQGLAATQDHATLPTC
jgi:flagellar biosynthesis protein FlhA